MQRLTTVRSITKADSRVERTRRNKLRYPVKITLASEFRKCSPGDTIFARLELVDGEYYWGKEVQIGIKDPRINPTDQAFMHRKEAERLAVAFVAEHARYKAARLSFYMEPTNIMEVDSDLVP